MATSSILMLFLLGLMSAAVLAVASRFLRVEEDPRIAAVEACFPGANCGGCGYPGCAAAAAAVVKGQAAPEICVAGGPDIAENVAAVMGLKASFKEPRVVHGVCTGGSRASLLFDYEGIRDCRAEALLYGGDKSCGLGCIGLGSCVKVCGFQAIRLNGDGLPVVDTHACRSCGKCAEVCPTGAIRVSGLSADLLHLNGIDDCLAPCMQKCPAQIDVRAYIQQLKQGDLRGALLTLKERNPLPSAVGRICPAPCETICRRNIVDEGVAIHTLHRFLADWEMQSGQRVTLACNPPTGHRVAVIGGGPAGLACAYFLRRVGHEPVIFEKRQEVGGMLTGVIPEFRLPRKAVGWDIQAILDLGVEVRAGVEFGRDITFKDLETQGFEAVFIATGAWRVPGLEIENAHAEGVTDAISFLSGLKKSGVDLKGKRVVVVGDTNTAMDVLRCAARLGAVTQALIPCIRRKMSANKNDVTRAAELGCGLMFLTEPVRVLTENGKVTGIAYRRLQYDDPEKAAGKPKPVEGSEETMPADLIVAATGRFVDPAPFAGENLELDRQTGGVKADAVTLQTGLAHVFVGGEAHTGRNTLIQAIADGRRAARSIHHFVTGKAIPRPTNLQLGVIPESILKNMDVLYSIPRVTVPEISVEERLCTFKEVEGAVSHEAARKEASRCLRCGLTCYDHCAGAEYAADVDVRKRGESRKELTA